MDEKDISDQDAVLLQLDQLGYDYFIEELKVYVTHFILSSVGYH